MDMVILVLRGFIILALEIIQIAMLIRAVISWFPIDSNKFTDFLYVITEPLIAPVRGLFNKFHWFEGLPIDMSFFATFMLISILLLVL